MSRYVVLAAIAAALLITLPVPARADAIDGNWCSSDSRHFAIDGPRITTPGGAQIIGEYDRHAFSYIVPDTEPDAGRKVDMILVDENTIHLTINTEDSNQAPVEVWRRCELTT